MSIKAEPTFSLKDELFNKGKVSKIAGEIEVVYPKFQKRKFVKLVTDRFPELELMERLHWIKECLRECLPGDYRAAVGTLLESLPPPCNPALRDNDFGDFIYGPYGAFVAEYGCTKADLQFSLGALKEMTKRFSVEFPIRSFINAFPKETLNELHLWTQDDHYHVRRLTSEGTRPKLPWAKKIHIHYAAPLPILDALYADSARFVTRSVANHMNDISKVDPDMVIQTLKRWQKLGMQRDKEMSFIVRHSLRTLEKQGHTEALQLLGYKQPQLKVKIKQYSKLVQIGKALEFSFSVTSTANNTQSLLIDYILYFQKKDGSLAPKTFKIAKTTIQPVQTQTFSKRQPLRPMTTRVLYHGRHAFELQINGENCQRKEFLLTSS